MLKSPIIQGYVYYNLLYNLPPLSLEKDKAWESDTNQADSAHRLVGRYADAYTFGAFYRILKYLLY